MLRSVGPASGWQLLMNAPVYRRLVRQSRPESRRPMVVCGVIGVAMMAAVDEIVFHQPLGWHHFYDRSTTSVGLTSDGLLSPWPCAPCPLALPAGDC